MDNINKDEIILVSGGSSVKNVAVCLVKFLEKSAAGEVELRAMGASACNQMIKAVAVARGMVGMQGYDLCLRVGFCEANIGEERKTALRAIAFIKN